MKKQKYYWYSFCHQWQEGTNCESKVSLQHPFVEIAARNNEATKPIQLINWKEISSVEYDMFRKLNG